MQRSTVKSVLRRRTLKLFWPRPGSYFHRYLWLADHRSVTYSTVHSPSDLRLAEQKRHLLYIWRETHKSFRYQHSTLWVRPEFKQLLSGYGWPRICIIIYNIEAFLQTLTILTISQTVGKSFIELSIHIQSPFFSACAWWNIKIIVGMP